MRALGEGRIKPGDAGGIAATPAVGRVAAQPSAPAGGAWRTGAEALGRLIDISEGR